MPLVDSGSNRHADHSLQFSLRLHRVAQHSEAHPPCAVLSHEARDDGVVEPLAGCDLIRMPRCGNEIRLRLCSEIPVPETTTPEPKPTCSTGSSTPSFP